MGTRFSIFLGVIFALQLVLVVYGVRRAKKRSRELAGMLPAPVPPSLWRPIILGVSMLAVFTAIPLVLSSGGSVLIAMLGAVPMSLMFVAMGFFARVKHRRGTTPRCSACEYDLAGTQADAHSGDTPSETKCPECGTVCGQRGTIVYGEKVWSNRPLLIGCLLLLPLFVKLTAPMIFGFAATGAFMGSLIPTGSLIKQATYSKSFRMTEWAELRTRTLTDAQRDTLARGLLTREALQLHAWGDEAKWLIAEFTAGRLSLETKQLALQRFADLGLFPKEPDGTMAIRPTHAQAWGLQGCFAGYTILAVRGPVLDSKNQEIAPPSPQEFEISLVALGDPARGAVDPTSPRKALYSLFGTVPPSSHLSVWIIAEPRVRTPQPVVWNNGVPVTAPDAIVVRFDLKPPMK